MKKNQVLSINRLTPMQNGMLFHTLMNENGLNYHEQTCLYIDGLINPAIFKQAWQEIVNRYEVFRTDFRWKETKTQIQIVLQNKLAEFSFYDISDLSSAGQQEYLDEFKARDLQQSFDFEAGKLNRMSLIKLSENRFYVCWSFHHIIMDGWSVPIVLSDLLEIYRSLEKGFPLPEKPLAQFSDYLRWLKGKEKERVKAMQFWEKYLSQLTEPTTLPVQRKRIRGDMIHTAQVSQYEVGPEMTRTIDEFCKQFKITNNALMQTAWGVLLQKYNNTNVSCFGMTVSGRPAEIKYVEKIVGLFINTLPVCVTTSTGTTLVKLLQQVNEDLLEIREYEYTSLIDIQKQVQIDANEELFDSLLVFENYPSDAMAEKREIQLSFDSVHELTNYDLTLAMGIGETTIFKFVYNPVLFGEVEIKRIFDHMLTIITTMVSQTEKLVADLSILNTDEKKTILYQFNQTSGEYLHRKTITELFEEQVRKNPDQIAIVFKTQSLTYRELNSKANQLARMLIVKGVVLEDVIAVLAERSLERYISYLAVLKAGAAYLPIDPKYPKGRIEYMLKDSGSKIILTHACLISEYQDIQAVLNIDDPNNYQGFEHNLKVLTNSQNLAYIIYTSGSTGKPKGVMLAQQGIANLQKYFAQQLDLTAEDRIIQFASCSFDASVWETYMALTAGATLFVVPEEVINDYRMFETFLNENQITLVTLPPVYLNYLKPANVNTLRMIITAGSATNYELIKSWRDKVRYINAYGPTETTICATTYEVTQSDEQIYDNVPIGKPILNNRVYIVDKDFNLCPVGVVGELCVTSDGLARGYLKRSELTAEKFVDNPFEPGQKMYRTGDLARWLSDGNIEFIGRIDFQVKIRGHRVELGEIENQLVTHDKLKEVAVIDRKDQFGNTYLCAYIVEELGATVQITELRDYLTGQLPDYMIPTFFVKLTQLPVTPNGKVDRKVLPTPDNAIQTEYVAPTNPDERKLAEIWAENLGISKVGINDNFFELGGDSIKAIQILAKATQKDINLTVKDIFTHKTISAILNKVSYSEGALMISQQEVVGPVPLSPIQQWFFEQNYRKPHYWNMTNLFKLLVDVDLNLLKQAFQKLITHHDALRMRFQLTKDGIMQENRSSTEVSFILEEHDLSALNYEAQKTEMIRISQKTQSQWDLARDLLIKGVVFDLGQNGKRLLIPIHHLIVDMVSWQIILTDLETFYATSNPRTLALKTTSFQDWTQKLHDYATFKNLDLAYWKNLDLQKIRSLITENIENNHLTDYRTLLVELDSLQTQKLCSKVNWVYNTEITDILLSSLIVAYQKAMGSNSILLALEGHGREELFNNVNISRTVGWFTSLYPVYLEIKENLSQTIKFVKDSLRRVPHKGLDFGIGRYLQEDEHLQQLNPEISFNYLGQRDLAKAQNNGNKLLSPCKEDSGMTLDLAEKHPFLISINGFIENEKLHLNLSYNSRVISDQQMQMFKEAYQKCLLEIIQHCIHQDERVYTAADYQVATEFTENNFDLIVQAYSDNGGMTRIESIHKLHPIQCGLMVYNLLDEGRKNYYVRTGFFLEGQIDLEMLKKAWQEVVNRYQILRSDFRFKEAHYPIQIISQDKVAEIYLEDISELSSDEQLIFIHNYKIQELEKPFDFHNGNLNRLSIIQLSRSRYYLCWTFHHLLLDGWSGGIILNDWFGIYHCLTHDLKLPEKPRFTYTDYLNWWQNQDLTGSKKFWATYLQGYQLTLLPYDQPKTEIVREVEFNTLHLSQELTKKINKFCKTLDITPNVFYQTAWGLLLQIYNQDQQSCTGMVVSGRGIDLPGIDKIVGMFVQAIPIIIRSNSDTTLRDLLLQVNKDLIEIKNHEYLPLAEIQKLIKRPPLKDIFDSIVIFENYPIGQATAQKNLEYTLTSESNFEQHHYDITIQILSDKATLIRMMYNKQLFKRETIEKVNDDLLHMITKMVEQPESSTLSCIQPQMHINQFIKEIAYSKTTINANSESVNTLERKLNTIYQLLLGIQKISRDDCLFTLGGSSLTVIQLAAAIYREFNLHFPLRVFFQKSTVKELAEVIMESQEN